jgi:hypothetical protein
MQARDMTDEEVISLGYRALIEKLGPSCFVRFVNLHNPPEGDYTQTDKPINHMSVEEIYAEATRIEAERRSR